MTQANTDDQLLVRTLLPSDAATVKTWRNQTGVPLSSAAMDSGSGEGEWLILADAASTQPLACLRLVPHLGLQMPRYSYHVGRVVHAAVELGLYRSQTTLLLGNDHSAESELADMAYAPGLSDAAKINAQVRLIQAALQRVQAQPARFGERLIVELAGPRDQSGDAPFWQGLGAHFYVGDPAAAQTKFGDAWRSHLAALLPRQTLYLSFLSECAQAAMGKVGDNGQPAAQALAACGFGFSQHVRIDDGGPVWERRLR
ncbi:arginine N-succinyltransferase [Roseateles sp.]|uniref:arginine N-succinyltransferase n=1 Tax=Roseateles sp. TaxID=1971397 RepID=UPI00286B15EA|nr:arginine N-succinyltransferase [Roseateles sp.]